MCTEVHYNSGSAIYRLNVAKPVLVVADEITRLVAVDSLLNLSGGIERTPGQVTPRRTDASRFHLSHGTRLFPLFDLVRRGAPGGATPAWPQTCRRPGIRAAMMPPLLWPELAPAGQRATRIRELPERPYRAPAGRSA